MTAAADQDNSANCSQQYEKPLRRPPSLLQDILGLLIKIFAILTVFMLLFTFLFGINTMEDMSMAPAVQANDIVFFYRLTNEYVASDVTLLKYEGKQQVRRVIAIAGDTVDVTEEGLFINGSLIAEQSSQKTLLYEEGITFPVTIPEGHVFVLGDNRKDSVDSRMYGAVSIKDLSGKVITIIRQNDI